MLEKNIDSSLMEFCEKLRKIELHAHVIGSVSDVTLRKILKRRHSEKALDHHVYGDMSDVFAMFKTLHDLIDNNDDVYTVTYDVVHEFAEDGVEYLELRSTPRDVPSTGMTKRNHVETMIRAIQDCKHLPCVTRLLLSIDRRHGPECAKEVVDLALEFKKTGIVVGVDLSGNPTFTDTTSFKDELIRAKHNGLKISMHLSEVPDENSEAAELLTLKPDRIGHATFLSQKHGGTEQNESFVSQNLIPLEVCLTSNLKTKTVQTYKDHHFTYWYRQGHPLLICTDDKGVFRTTLSQEYAVAMTVFGLTRDEMKQMVVKSVEYIFEGEEVKQKLRSKLASDAL